MSKQESQNGFVYLHRKTQKSWIRRDPVAAHVFFSWFLLEAAWKPYIKEWNSIKIPLKRGEAVFGRMHVAEALGLTEKQVRNAVQRLTQRASIRASKRASKYTVYFVVEYDTYQPQPEAEGPAKARQDKTPRATIKEVEKKLKEIKNSFNGNFTSDFWAKWEEWEIYRKEKKNVLTPTTVKKQLNQLAKLSGQLAIDTLEASMFKGWAGLFPDKIKNNEPAQSGLSSYKVR